MTIVALDNLASVTLSPNGNRVYLTNSGYTLNGETIEVDVVGSPGLQKEEIKTIALTGSNSYVISWDRPHTNHEVVVNISTADTSKTPTLDFLKFKHKAINGDATPSDSVASPIQSSESGTLQEQPSKTSSTATTITSSETISP